MAVRGAQEGVPRETGDILTGHKVSPQLGSVAAEEIILKADQLPLLIQFNGRHYILLATRGGGLLLNGR